MPRTMTPWCIMLGELREVLADLDAAGAGRDRLEVARALAVRA